MSRFRGIFILYLFEFVRVGVSHLLAYGESKYMGCGGSKQAANETELQPAREPARLDTARPQTNRPPTSSNRPSSQRPASSKRPSSGSNRPSTGSKRPSSSSNRPPSSSHRPSSSSRPPGSSRRTGSAQGGRRPKSSYQAHPTIYEDHTPEDNDIIQGIIVLCTLIDQHSERFYGQNYSSYVRRTVGEQLVNYITSGGGNVETTSNDLSAKLRAYASGLGGDKRGDHIVAICDKADKVKRMLRKHPSEWTFEPFGNNVWFPGVYQDGAQVKEPEPD
ncbi:hypothetical protein AOQ84DRAFT_382371 [Glonium stellatum]|uniref:Uncharacterized protein n=1 Tax=Glonium stellatum TaxID=574774 RepID=A0A8E2JME2_9PEZI|nr:hypothetical protein AOQ84DRAFT_382371 [Glonium stellatum]